MSYDNLLTHRSEDRSQDYTSAECNNDAGIDRKRHVQTNRLPFKDPTSSGITIEFENLTPQRKFPTSSRFINAFQHLYTGTGFSATSNSTSTITSCSGNASGENLEPLANSSTNRTPTKCVESKILSMWHNVRYGWSNKIKSNFSKEQPVWLLGRCYHRKSTPSTSMENSIELDSALLDNKIPPSNAYESIQNVLPSNDEKSVTSISSSHIYPSLDPLQTEGVVTEELGMDAIESEVADNRWEEGIEGFRRDFYSRLWMTYRREFPIMNGTNYTSDCGWGCMLRSGQMLLAQALVCHFLGRNWRYDSDTQLHTTYEDNMHKKIIKWFGDSSSKSSPFSIHALVSLGKETGKKPGDWYGPASVSYLLKQALRNASQENADFDNITIYVAKDCTNVKDECYVPEQRQTRNVPWNTKFKTESDLRFQKRELQKSVIILIPLRLGTEKLNSVYAHCLKLLLSTEYCIGIIGGRPKHSLYFVGFQEDKLIHLDPHYCQEMVDVNQENFPMHSFHCKSPRKLKTSKLDPSCCIGFYCQTRTDFDNFVESVQLYLNPLRSSGVDKVINSAQQMSAEYMVSGQCTEMNYPLFTFSRGRCLDHEKDNTQEEMLYKPLRCQLAEIQLEINCSTFNDDDSGETEEFVIL